HGQPTRPCARCKHMGEDYNADSLEVLTMLDSVLSGSGIDQLVQPGRVHRRVYTDPQIFELEMERLFGRAWLFVGHESQVRTPGDFITTDLGRYPVIM